MVALYYSVRPGYITTQKKKCRAEGSIKVLKSFQNVWSALLGSVRLGHGLNYEPPEFMLTKAGLKAQPDVCFLMNYSFSFTLSNYSEPKSHQ